MSDELQTNDNPENDENELGTIENLEEGSELAPEADKPADSDKTQETIDKAIGKQHKKFRDEERRANGLEVELADAKSKLGQYQADENQPVDIPKMPDQYDDDFNEQVEKRDEAIRRNAEITAQVAVNTQNQQNAQIAAQQKEVDVINNKVVSYTEKATGLGVTPQELQEAGNTVASYGIPADLTIALLDDPDGPLITKYLAANPLEIDSLKNMSTFQAALHIEKVIRPKTDELKPKTSNTPAPQDDIEGGSVDTDNRYENLKGVTYS